MNAIPKTSDFVPLSRRIRTGSTAVSCPHCGDESATIGEALVNYSSRAGLAINYFECPCCGGSWRQIDAK